MNGELFSVHYTDMTDDSGSAPETLKLYNKLLISDIQFQHWDDRDLGIA